MPVDSWPTELRVNPTKDRLRLAFDDGSEIVLSAEKLRVESPSAEVRGHGAKKPPLSGKQDVKILALEPVGNYAVRIVFDDGHDSGLFSWDYLKKLARP
jgi:DUF971 family protein